ncbi:Uncharacterised protein [Mycobacteroides abscessus subsp. abscessus]|nr:Uncharacterised protein [Mycobacteroides abscessus subsp. abscessus]
MPSFAETVATRGVRSMAGRVSRDFGLRSTARRITMAEKSTRSPMKAHMNTGPSATKRTASPTTPMTQAMTIVGITRS